MPISAKEALNNVFTLELKGDEEKWFRNLCEYTDYYIEKNFNGDEFTIDLTSMYIRKPGLSDKNCSSTSFNIKSWRQTAVVKHWISIYERVGWQITGNGNIIGKNGYYRCYIFKADTRDMKIDEILS